MILLTSYPPQVAVAFTPEQMARLDRRFQSALPADPQRLLHDSATLLNAALDYTRAGQAWTARPDQSLPGGDMTEPEWERQLALTTPARDVPWPTCQDLPGWSQGAVYLFTHRLLRGYNLSDELERLELEFLLAEPQVPGRVLRGHRLLPDGQLSVWRAVSA